MTLYIGYIFLLAVSYNWSVRFWIHKDIYVEILINSFKGFKTDKYLFKWVNLSLNLSSHKGPSFKNLQSNKYFSVNLEISCIMLHHCKNVFITKKSLFPTI